MAYMNDQPTNLESSFVNSKVSSFVGVGTLNGLNTIYWAHIRHNSCPMVIFDSSKFNGVSGNLFLERIFLISLPVFFSMRVRGNSPTMFTLIMLFALLMRLCVTPPLCQYVDYRPG